MKKALIFMLVLVLCAGILSSCQTDKTTGPETTAAATDGGTAPITTGDAATGGDANVTAEPQGSDTTQGTQTPDGSATPAWTDDYSGEY